MAWNDSEIIIIVQIHVTLYNITWNVFNAINAPHTYLRECCLKGKPKSCRENCVFFIF